MFSRDQILENYTDLIIAPLSGFTIKPFRQLLREYGFKGLYYTEMLNPYEIKKGKVEKIDILDKESPVGVQLFGGYKKGLYKETMNRLKEYGRFDIIDLNMGCPIRKVVHSGGGVHLLKNIDEAKYILKEIRSEWDGPLSIKTRIGFTMDDIDNTIVKLKELLVFEPDFFSIHFRTVEEKFTPPPHWDLYKKFKEELKIFIYLNGGVYDKNTIKYIKRTISPDGIMLSRGILYDPFIFSEDKGGLMKKISFSKKFLRYFVNSYGEKRLKETRKFFAYLFKGEIYSREFKKKVYSAQNYDEYIAAFEIYDYEL